LVHPLGLVSVHTLEFDLIHPLRLVWSARDRSLPSHLDNLHHAWHDAPTKTLFTGLQKAYSLTNLATLQEGSVEDLVIRSLGIADGHAVTQATEDFEPLMAR
jgi:hypothetical protein